MKMYRENGLISYECPGNVERFVAPVSVEYLFVVVVALF